METRTAIDEREREVANAREMTMAYVHALAFAFRDTARDPKYRDNHLLSVISDDLMESAFALPILLDSGVPNAALREARFLLEASIKLCYVQQSRQTATIAQKLTEFQKLLDSSSISPKADIELYLLPDDRREEFLVEVGRAYGLTSKYVHLTVRQLEQRIAQLASGRTAGKDTAEEVAAVNQILATVFDCALVLLFHSVPPYVSGDWFVEKDGKTVNWLFASSPFLALIDEHYDYKAERQPVLEQVKAERIARARSRN
jgi:hypothetical protein